MFIKYWLNPNTSMIINVKNNNSTAQRIILPLALVDASLIPINSFPSSLTPTSNSFVPVLTSIILFFSSISSPCNFGGGDGYCPHVQNILQHLQFLFILKTNLDINIVVIHIKLVTYIKIQLKEKNGRRSSCRYCLGETIS